MDEAQKQLIRAQYFSRLSGKPKTKKDIQADAIRQQFYDNINNSKPKEPHPSDLFDGVNMRTPGQSDKEFNEKKIQAIREHFYDNIQNNIKPKDITIGRALHRGMIQTGKAIVDTSWMSMELMSVVAAEAQDTSKHGFDKLFKEIAINALIQGLPGGNAILALKHISPDVYKKAAKKLDHYSSKKLKIEDYRRPDGVRGFGYDLVEGVPQMFAMTAAFALTMGLGGYAVAASQVAGSDYRESRDKGVGIKRAATAAMGDAAVQAPLEMLSIKKLLGKWVPTKSAVKAIKEIAGTMGTEWFTETIQSMPQLASKIWAESEGKSLGEQVDKFTANFWEALKQGAYEGLVAMVHSGGLHTAKISAQESVDWARKRRLKEPPPLPPKLEEQVNRKLMGNESREELAAQPPPDINKAFHEELTDAELKTLLARRNSGFKKLSKDTKKNLKSFALGVDNALGNMSTQLRFMDERLKYGMRGYVIKSMKSEFENKTTIDPFFQATKKLTPRMDRLKGKRSPQWMLYDKALQDGDIKTANAIEKKYGFEAEAMEARKLLEKIYADGQDAGIEMGYVENMWPRVVADYEGLMNHLYKSESWGDISRALRKQDAESEHPLDVQEQAEYLSTLMRGYGDKIVLSAGDHAQARKIEFVRDEIRPFYMDFDQAMSHYITQMTANIEKRKFFGQTSKHVKSLKRTLSGYKDDLVAIENAKKRNRVWEYGALEIEKLKERASALNKKLINPFFLGLKNNAKKRLAREDILSEMERVRDRQAILEEIKTNEGFDKYADDMIKVLKAKIMAHEEMIKNKMVEGTDSSIGVFILEALADGKIKPNQEQQLRSIIKAVFSAKGTSGAWNTYKNLSYIATMGSGITSAITQAQDIAFSFADNGILNSLSEVGKAVVRKNKIDRSDVYLKQIAEEFADTSLTGKAVTATFKAVLIEYADGIGKTTYINSSLKKYQQMAANEAGRKKLLKHITPMFGEEEAKRVAADLVQDNLTDGVKMLLLNDLMDVQPLSVLDNPMYYAIGGNYRMFYMLKTYQLKLLDYYRNKSFDMMNGDTKKERIEGMSRILKLTLSLTALGAPGDCLKDFLLGREFDLTDIVVDSLLKIIGVSRYTAWTARREGLGTAIAKMVFFPFAIAEKPFKDVMTLFEDPDKLEGGKNLETLSMLPAIGQMYDWWIGSHSNSKSKAR